MEVNKYRPATQLRSSEKEAKRADESSQIHAVAIDSSQPNGAEYRITELFSTKMYLDSFLVSPRCSQFLSKG